MFKSRICLLWPGTEVPNYILTYLFGCVRTLLKHMVFPSCGLSAWLLSGMWDLNFLTRDRNCVPCTARFNHWRTMEVLAIIITNKNLS